MCHAASGKRAQHASGVGGLNGIYSNYAPCRDQYVVAAIDCDCVCCVVQLVDLQLPVDFWVVSWHDSHTTRRSFLCRHRTGVPTAIVSCQNLWRSVFRQFTNNSIASLISVLCANLLYHRLFGMLSNLTFQKSWNVNGSIMFKFQCSLAASTWTCQML